MQITKSPTLQHEMIELAQYPLAPVRRIFRRIDRILGGEPEPIKPVKITRIAGRMSWSEGEALLEEGELIQFGVKFREPVICNITGHSLYGFTPIEIEGRKVRFMVDHIES